MKKAQERMKIYRFLSLCQIGRTASLPPHSFDLPRR
jgi:hypothetical protein